MEIKRLRTLALEIFDALNNLNPNFMKEIFYISPRNTHRKHDIFFQIRKTTKYGDNSLRAMGPHLENSLPEKNKFTTSYLHSKILSKLVLDRNANVNCALSNPLYS